MSMDLKISKTNSLGGKNFPQSKTISGDSAAVAERSVQAAQDGTLTTRTSDSVGTITMASTSHTITTGARVDLYWSGGMRRGVTVGTVSGTSVPITVGAGDNLPNNLTDLTVSIPKNVTVEVLGTNLKGLLFYTAKRGQVVLEDSGGTEHFQKQLEAEGSWDWFDGNGETNPITGDTISDVYLSHGETTAQTMRIGMLYN